MARLDVDWRQQLPKETSLSFPLDPDGERVFAAHAQTRDDGVVMAHLTCNSQGGGAGSGVPLTEIADRTHRVGGDYAGFLDDGHFRMDRSVAVDLSSEQTERLVHWARVELGLVDLSVGSRSRLSPLAG